MHTDVKEWLRPPGYKNGMERPCPLEGSIHMRSTEEGTDLLAEQTLVDDIMEVEAENERRKR
jgi:hypothetical protein